MQKAILSTAFILLFGLGTMAQQAESFGVRIDPEGALQPTEFIQEMDGKVEQHVKLTAKVNDVCQMKGCWMTLDLENGEQIRVRFKDYEFFVPKDASGQTAVVEGRAYYDEVSVETLRHYAEDAGKPKEEIEAITKPEMKLNFVADGVLLKSE